MAQNPKIMVHTCCTVCASYVFSQLKKAGFTPIALFYNPEVDLDQEYHRRLADLVSYCKDDGIKLIIPFYDSLEYSEIVESYKDKNSIKYITDKDRYRRRRCLLCNSLVVQKTIEQAKKLRLKYFSTTLLCSPYKDHDELINISNEMSLDYHVGFYYQDFRKGYWMGRNFGRNHNMYIPSYCGCRESDKERRLE